MNIDINEIGNKGLVVEDYIELDDFYLLEDDSFFSDSVYFTMTFSNEGNGRIKAKGKVRTEVSMKCVKCLEKYENNINSKFDIVLFPMDIIDADNSALNPEELEYIFYEGDKIDIKKILQEQINFFIPMNPVCSTSCKGICQNCGANLNNESCRCENTINDNNLFSNKLKR